MTDTSAPADRPGRPRRIAFTVVAALAALLTGFLTLGALGSVVGGETPDDRFAALVHVPWLALGWCAAFVAMLWQADRRPAAYQQGLGMGAGLLLGGLLSREGDFAFLIGFGLVLVLLGGLHPARRAVWRPGPTGISPVLVPFALLLAAPCTLYAVQMLDRFRESGPDGPFYLGIATAALAVPLVGLVAGLRAPGWRLPLWTTGGMLVVLAGAGVAAMPAPPPASPPDAWALAGLAAAVAFVAAGEWEAHRSRQETRREAHERPDRAAVSG